MYKEEEEEEFQKRYGEDLKVLKEIEKEKEPETE